MLHIELRARQRNSEYAFSDATFSVVFHGRFDAVPAPNQESLTCTITHGCAVNDATGQVAIDAKGTSVVALQGTVTGHRRRFIPNTNQPVLAPAFVPQHTLRICLLFFFNKNPGPILADDLEYTGQQAVDIPVGPDWFGEIHITLVRQHERIESFRVPLARRGWGLPAAFGSSYAPLRQLEELQRTLRTPHQLENCMAEVRKWLRQASPRATYPVRANNAVTFYNDASEDSKGNKGAFADIHAAMAQAKHFIFIADWSFHPEVYLKRPQGGPNDQHQVGKMLINKALRRNFAGQPDPANIDEKILVAIHTWHHFDKPADDDPQNNRAMDSLRTMHQTINPGREFPENLLWRATERSGVLKTHHQKFVVLDAPVPNSNKRELKVFFGGLDLTTGRFDWPRHPIDNPWADPMVQQHTVFQSFGDWYNPEFKAATNLPRQPWHDIHAQLVGPAAWDFVFEFVGRWSVGAPGFQVIHGPWDRNQLVWKKFQELLSDPNFVRPFDAPPALPVPQGQLSARPWSAQVYRSMEKKFWHEPGLEGTQSRNAPNFLRWGLDKDYEKSIHKAYLQAIKRAENFIYIETQYLISGDYLKEKWMTQGHNHIPTAIVNRILEKYEQQAPASDFHVYIVLPMFPEGAPDDPKLRPVRYFQWETIRWMKEELEREMAKIDQRQNRQVGNKKKWHDYLSFYFLGNRSGLPTANHAGAVGRAAKVDTGKRYMIYVHSKLMIVDDEWILIGSANLNERSMSGRSDSEICVGMWATPGNEATCRQEIQAFRERLWREHLGDSFIDNNQYVNFAFDQPHRPATYRAVQDEARENRRSFINGQNRPQGAPMGHLMLWPLDNPAFAGMFIPDSGDTGDEWLVMPRRRGIGMLAPNEFLL